VSFPTEDDDCEQIKPKKRTAGEKFFLENFPTNV
jgi:hypothetical protein